MMDKSKAIFYITGVLFLVVVLTYANAFEMQTATISKSNPITVFSGAIFQPVQSLSVGSNTNLVVELEKYCSAQGNPATTSDFYFLDASNNQTIYFVPNIPVQLNLDLVNSINSGDCSGTGFISTPIQIPFEWQGKGIKAQVIIKDSSRNIVDFGETIFNVNPVTSSEVQQLQQDNLVPIDYVVPETIIYTKTIDKKVFQCSGNGTESDVCVQTGCVDGSITDFIPYRCENGSMTEYSFETTYVGANCEEVTETKTQSVFNEICKTCPPPIVKSDWVQASCISPNQALEYRLVQAFKGTACTPFTMKDYRVTTRACNESQTPEVLWIGVTLLIIGGTLFVFRKKLFRRKR